MNTNFANLAAAVTEVQDGRAAEPVLGAAVADWTSIATASTDPSAVVDGLEVTIETDGRAVDVQLVGSGAQPFLSGGGANSASQFTFRLERRTEGEDVDWVSVEDFYWRTAVGGSVTSTDLRFPPTVVSASDTPPAGSTTYRVLGWTEPEAANPGVRVVRVRLRAQQLATVAAN